MKMVTNKNNFLGTRKPPNVIMICGSQESLLGPFSEIKFHKGKNKPCYLAQQMSVHILLFFIQHLLT